MALAQPPGARFGKPEDLKSFRPAPAHVRTYHTVTDKSQSLKWISEHYRVSAAQLIGLNFPGAVVSGRVIPEVVNWYLHHHVQFRCPETADKKNRIFSGGERVAIPGQVIDIEDPLVIVSPAKRLNIWVGAGYKAGTTFGIVGNETGQVTCISLDDPTKGFTATITASRLGGGVGASGAPVLVFITSMQRAHELEGLMTGGWGYNIALGAKLNGILRSGKTAQAVKALTEYGEKLRKMGRGGAAAVKAGAKVAEYNSQIVDAIKTLGMDLDATEPQVQTFEIPVGGFGAEVSIVHTVTRFHVEYASD